MKRKHLFTPLFLITATVLSASAFSIRPPEGKNKQMSDLKMETIANTVNGERSGPASTRTETFVFISNGKPVNGKIHLPGSYPANMNLPAIFLIDFTEQHFKLATDEFEKVVNGVEKLNGVDALVVSLEEILDIDAEPDSFSEHYQLFKDLVDHVDQNYTQNPERTFIGKGSESGVVLMALFLEDPEGPDASVFDNFIATDPSSMYASALIELLESGDVPQNKTGKKLHFSYSTSNDKNKCDRLIKLIREANYPWLTFESVEYTDSNYENTYPISYAEGIEFVFDR